MACLTKQHRKHDVIDIEEEKRESLFMEIDAVMNELQIKKVRISAVQTQLEKNNENCIIKIGQITEKFKKTN